MPDSPLRNPVVWTTGLTALVAAATLAYNVWQDHRRLKITLRPLRRGHVFPIDGSRTKSRVVFTVGLIAHNPGKTPNQLLSVRAWRDDQEVPPVSPGDRPSIAPHTTVTRQIPVVAFDATDDVDRAYSSMSTITVEVRARRGRRCVTFDRDAFPRTG